MTDPRYLAVKLLCQTFSGGSYSNIRLSSGLDSSDLDQRGRRLCSAIYYGVIGRRITLDHIIGRLSARPIGKLDDVIVNILRCGIYQILYMDSVPDNAAVNESVGLAKKFRKASASGMVNAILRTFIRGGKSLDLPKNSLSAMSVELSAPEELVSSLTADYGSQHTESFLRFALEAPVTYLRRNHLRCSHEELIEALGELPARQLRQFSYAVENGDVTATEAFKRGFFHVQDLSSQLCCEALAPTEMDTVLDICAAPGGKTFTMAELMNGKGKIFAFDLHEKRAGLIRSGAERLGLTNISAKAGDATVFDPDMPKFTKILCDVPCSGFGVIGRKPEIRYKSLSEFSRLPEIQYNIARNALNYLAPGGELVYSTCTLRKAENDQVVERLLRENADLEPVILPELPGLPRDSKATLFPSELTGDGFFIAKFRKVR
ncbi:MAG: 16S rRNA (cytosine(967)-C(5))-methyltransferase RsmB [Ruminococcus sp.]|nr:16S rRNA (cytosine(967)-C(5))-methyltransferase RsmB [Ruminococcus sp.]